MKLRNKKTGIIGEAGYTSTTDGTIIVINIDEPDEWYDYTSLTELNKEWEDVEEPEEYWYIDDAGVIQVDQVLSSEINMRKSIENYFETREKAEKAVEKLKAWKRLKDNFIKRITVSGCNGALDRKHILLAIRTKSYYSRSKIDRAYLLKEYEEFANDLDVLFGGNDE